MKTESHWKRVGLRAHHGICLPLWALRTEKNCGIGEFFDLFPLIAWAQGLGFDCLQLLPLNDTGWDLSPYNSLSSCALDPIYLSLWDLSPEERFEEFQSYKNLPRLERSAVKKLKLKWLRAYFEKIFPSFSSSPSYRSFVSEHPWLAEYSRFMAFKDAFEWKHWKDWPQNPQEDQAAIDFHSFLQYLCFSQLKKVRAFASARAFHLIGDMSYLLSPDSADVWAHRSFFRLDMAAGAPPDKYNVRGQNWGFPLFDWEAMQKDGYAWWKQRLFVMENFYHIYRIDHVVGFFRIWAIAQDKKPSAGSFIPADRNLWLDHGCKILEMMIDASLLLPIAEDLGTIPHEVYSALKNFGICGTKVLRWQEDIPFKSYEPFSMTTVSTPDMEPLPLWWQKYPEEAERFALFKGWRYEPILSSKKQIEILRDAHHTSSYFHINLLQEYFFPFSELYNPNLEEEQINVPGMLLPTNWTYRLTPSLESFIEHRSLNETIRNILLSPYDR